MSSFLSSQLPQGVSTNIYLSRPANPRRGDLMIFPTDNRVGGANRRGRHTNQGYSGFIVLVIWDGNALASLTRKCREQIGIGTTEFEYRYEADAIREGVIGKLSEFFETHSEIALRSWWYKGRKYADFGSCELVQSNDVHRGVEHLATEHSS